MSEVELHAVNLVNAIKDGELVSEQKERRTHSPSYDSHVLSDRQSGISTTDHTTCKRTLFPTLRSMANKIAQMSR